MRNDKFDLYLDEENWEAYVEFEIDPVTGATEVYLIDAGTKDGSPITDKGLIMDIWDRAESAAEVYMQDLQKN